MSINNLLKGAEGNSKSFITDTSYLDKLQEMGYKTPSIPVMSLSEHAEMCVSKNMGTYDEPIITVGIEEAKGDYFANLVVLVPDMKILYCNAFSEDEIHKYMKEIGSNIYTCMEASDGR